MGLPVPASRQDIVRPRTDVLRTAMATGASSARPTSTAGRRRLVIGGPRPPWRTRPALLPWLLHRLVLLGHRGVGRLGRRFDRRAVRRVVLTQNRIRHGAGIGLTLVHDPASHWIAMRPDGTDKGSPLHYPSSRLPYLAARRSWGHAGLEGAPSVSWPTLAYPTSAGQGARELVGRAMSFMLRHLFGGGPASHRPHPVRPPASGSAGEPGSFASVTTATYPGTPATRTAGPTPAPSTTQTTRLRGASTRDAADCTSSRAPVRTRTSTHGGCWPTQRTVWPRTHTC